MFTIFFPLHVWSSWQRRHFFLTVKFWKKTTDVFSLSISKPLHVYTLIQCSLFTLELLWGIFFVFSICNQYTWYWAVLISPYDALTIQVAHWSARNKRALIPRDCLKKHNMADVEEFPSCQTTIDIESLGTATPSSLCSTPELEIRGNESCLQADLRQMPECEESLAVKNGTISLSSDTSASLVNSKSRELKNNDSSSSVSSYIEWV